MSTNRTKFCLQMASQSEARMRKTAKPVISTDVMGNRNVEIRAVSAWVQPEGDLAEISCPEAVLSAVEEDYRMRQIQREKEERLKHFQEQVKRRVKKLENIRRQNMTLNNFKAYQHEGVVVNQSAFPSEKLTPRKDKCSLRKDKNLAIKIPAHSSRRDKETMNSQSKAFSDQTNQIHVFNKHARRGLLSKKIGSVGLGVDDDEDPLDEVWKANSNQEHASSKIINEADSIVTEEESTLEDLNEERNCELQDDVDEESEDVTELQSKSEKCVRFDLNKCKNDTRQKRMLRKSVPVVWHSRQQIPNIYAAVEDEQEKQRQKNQQAIYRRLFMDLEREQVKENLRRKEHRKRINRLKKEKEEERKREEEISQKLIEPRDPLTGETAEEMMLREMLEKTHIEETLKENELKLRKVREMERFVGALRHNLKEKMLKLGVQLPPLCCCGETLWDTNPDTCANNCVFYKNPRAYAKALQSLLVSCDVV